MQNIFTKNNNVLKLAILFFAIIVPTHFVHAQFFGSLDTIMASIIAHIANLGISITGYLVGVAGFLLNVSINLTLNIREVVNSTPAIFTTWRTLRDISGLFLIFFLLYAAIQLIVGYKKPNFDSLIKNIVMVGILINFSFFFTSLGIDASNVVSMQIYNAIAPVNSLNKAAATSDLSKGEIFGMGLATYDGGLSDIFMGTLKIQSIFNTKFGGANPEDTVTPGARMMTVTIMGVTGILIQLTAAVSFAAAAIAFIFRFVILLFLLAFSPILFMAYISPDIEKYAKDWVDKYKSMLIFMPVYLLLMYLALNVLTTSPLFGNSTASVSGSASIIGTSYAAAANAASSGGSMLGPLISLGVNAAVVIVMLNLPLVAAVSIAGKTIGILDKAQKNFGANKVWGTVGSWTGRNTYGRTANAVSESEYMKDAASKSRTAALLLKGTRAAGSEYKSGVDKQIKSQTEFAESLGANPAKLNEQKSVLRSFESQMASARARGANQSVIDQLKSNIGQTKGLISNIEKERSMNYARTIEKPNVKGMSLLSHYATDKTAAAKIEIPIVEKELIRNKDDLKEIRADIKMLKKAMNADPNGGTQKQKDDMAELMKDEVKKVNEVGRLETKIDELKQV